MDIIVIGAGIGGIASAAYLARAGHHVTMLKKSPRLGALGKLHRLPGVWLNAQALEDVTIWY